MSKNRIEKVNSLLGREIGKIIQREIFFPDKVLVTLTRADTTPNLIEAKIYISAYPENQIDKVLRILNREIFSIQQKINKKLNMRPIPRIKFIKDENLQKVAKIEELIRKIQMPEND